MALNPISVQCLREMSGRCVCVSKGQTHPTPGLWVSGGGQAAVGSENRPGAVSGTVPSHWERRWGGGGTGLEEQDRNRGTWPGLG